MERLPGDIVRRVLADAKGIELVRELDPQEGIAAAVRRTGVDFIIAGSGEEATAVEAFFADYARLQVLYVEDGDHVVIDQLARSRSPIGSLSPETLAALVGGDVAR